MGDARNKIRKELEREAIRKMQARLKGPPAPPFVPKCAGCGLNGLDVLKPGGGFVRIIHVAGMRSHEPGEFVCENCLEARTGIDPNDIP